MKHRSWLLLALSVSSPVFADFEYHGYMRSGFGYADGQNDQVCFKGLPGEQMKTLRLGNECDTYVEQNLVNIQKLENGMTARGAITFALASDGHKLWESTNGKALDVSLEEAYVELDKLPIEGTRIWVGKRFNRQDIYLTDKYYEENNGPGAGIMGLPLFGDAKAHVILVRNVPDEGPGQSNLDVKLEGVGLLGGSLSARLIYGYVPELARKDKAGALQQYKGLDGQRYTLEYQIPVANGFARATLQRGDDLFGGTNLDQFGAWGTQNVKTDEALQQRQASSATRGILFAVVQPLSSLSVGALAAYQDADDGSNRRNLTQAQVGVQPIYHFSDHYHLQFAAEWNRIENAIYSEAEGYGDAELRKLTIAPTLTLKKGFWERPQLRVFVTKAYWNDDLKDRAAFLADVYPNKTEGTSGGFQFEAWW
jgi:maltoporin